MFHRRTLGFIVLLSVACLLLGFNYLFRPFESQPPSLDPSPTPLVTDQAPTMQWFPEAAVAEILAMPLGVSNAASPSAQYQADLTWINQRQPGLVTLFGSTISTTSAQTAIRQIQTQYADQPPLIAVDHEGGTVQRLSGTGFTRLPSWQSLCAQPATRSAQLLQQSAQELKAVGVDLVLAPVIDVGNSSVLGSRLCSSDEAVVAERAQQYVQAFGSQQILPSLKHFPGIGASTRDLHFTFDRVTVRPEEALLYRQLLDIFPTLGVVVSHVGVSNQFPDIPCSLSPDCIGELKQNYPQVLVISDALEMEAAAYQAPSELSNASGSSQTAGPLTLAERAVRAVRAGNEVLLFGAQVTATEMEEVYQALLAESQRDPSFQALVEAAATKVRQTKNQL